MVLPLSPNAAAASFHPPSSSSQNLLKVYVNVAIFIIPPFQGINSCAFNSFFAAGISLKVKSYLCGRETFLIQPPQGH